MKLTIIAKSNPAQLTHEQIQSINDCKDEVLDLTGSRLSPLQVTQLLGRLAENRNITGLVLHDCEFLIDKTGNALEIFQNGLRKTNVSGLDVRGNIQLISDAPNILIQTLKLNPQIKEFFIPNVILPVFLSAATTHQIALDVLRINSLECGLQTAEALKEFLEKNQHIKKLKIGSLNITATALDSQQFQLYAHCLEKAFSCKTKVTVQVGNLITGSATEAQRALALTMRGLVKTDTSPLSKFVVHENKAVHPTFLNLGPNGVAAAGTAKSAPGPAKQTIPAKKLASLLSFQLSGKRRASMGAVIPTVSSDTLLEVKAARPAAVRVRRGSDAVTPTEKRATRLKMTSWVWEERTLSFQENWQKLLPALQARLVQFSNTCVAHKQFERVFSEYPPFVLLCKRAFKKLFTQMDAIYAQAKIIEDPRRFAGIFGFDEATQARLTAFLDDLYRQAINMLLDDRGNLKLEVIVTFGWEDKSRFYGLTAIKKLLISFVETVYGHCAHEFLSRDAAENKAFDWQQQFQAGLATPNAKPKARFCLTFGVFCVEEQAHNMRSKRNIFLNQQLVKQNPLLLQLKSCAPEQRDELMKKFILGGIEYDYRENVPGGWNAHRPDSRLALEYKKLQEIVARGQSNVNWLEALKDDLKQMMLTGEANEFPNLRMVLEKHIRMAEYYQWEKGLMIELDQLVLEKPAQVVPDQKSGQGRAAAQGGKAAFVPRDGRPMQTPRAPQAQDGKQLPQQFLNRAAGARR